MVGEKAASLLPDVDELRRQCNDIVNGIRLHEENRQLSSLESHKRVGVNATKLVDIGQRGSGVGKRRCRHRAASHLCGQNVLSTPDKRTTV